ncbi:MAG: S-methyl-5'-thioadenosine phosphorylase [Deltaproteobacteria bacterium]|nr:S-methyl-5'-thioadenosine phosphorylase [Deltaproteobacteria bacterium]
MLAIIGGSGLYNLENLNDVKILDFETPFGKPSSPLINGFIGETEILFLARHGVGHTLLPSEINYKANIAALKQAGATHLLSVSAVGSLKEHIYPGHLCIVSQYIDKTKMRDSTFFGNGIVGHVMFADPVCHDLSEIIFQAAKTLNFDIHKDVTLAVMEGPQFSTRAESRHHISIGADIIGMTSMPEAKLAREAELCYGNLALSTDYDCWKEDDAVTVEAVMKIMSENVEKSKQMIIEIAQNLQNAKSECSCSTALENTIVTQRNKIPQETIEKLKSVMGRVL